MKTYLFILILLSNASLISQEVKEEQSEKKSKPRSNSNIAPAYNQKDENEFNQEPASNSFDQIQSSVLSEASQNLRQTLNQIKQMSTQKTPTTEQVQKLNYELIKIKNVNKNSFEYHLYNYKVGNYDFDRIDNLKKAAKIQPNHPEVIKSLSAYNYILNDEKALKDVLNKMNEAKYFSTALNSFANDVLQSLPKNSILITHGEDDTYPLLISQYINSIRKDVQIISLDHLQSKTYRENLKKTGLKLPKSNVINISFFKQFVTLNHKNLVIATSIPKDYIQTIQDRIEVEGLGFRINDKKNTQRLKRQVNLYERTIRPALQKQFKGGYNNILSNYLPLLFEVRNYWIDQGNLSEVREIEKVILEVGKLSNNLVQVTQMLK